MANFTSLVNKYDHEHVAKLFINSKNANEVGKSLNFHDIMISYIKVVVKI
jgi:hypothetical protein